MKRKLPVLPLTAPEARTSPLDKLTARQYYPGMNAAKIAISIEPSLLQKIDSLVSRKLYRSRSEVFQLAVAEQIGRLDDDALARECSKLDPTEEQAFADIGLSNDMTEWPEY